VSNSAMVQVTERLDDLDMVGKFVTSLEKAGMKAEVVEEIIRIKKKEITVYTVWRHLTTEEKKDIKRGKLYISGNSLKYKQPYGTSHGVGRSKLY